MAINMRRDKMLWTPLRVARPDTDTTELKRY